MNEKPRRLDAEIGTIWCNNNNGDCWQRRKNPAWKYVGKTEDGFFPPKKMIEELHEKDLYETQST